MSIIYTEKGYGLHEAIRAAGHWLEQRDGVWISSNDTAVQAIIDAYTLDDAKASCCLGVEAKSRAVFDAAVSMYSSAEMSRWPILRAEALAYRANSAADVPSIAAEAVVRGCDVATLVGKILANAAQFNDLAAQIAGTSGRHRDVIRALDTFAKVAAYDFSADWPGV